MTLAVDSGLSVRYSPLHAVHLRAGASFTDFAGWQMPVRYSSDLAEHHTVRTAAGIFDLSHMSEIRVSGPDAPDFLDYALAGAISAIAVGQAKYTLILTEAGGITDDVVVYRTAESEFLIVANAGNRHQALTALDERTAGFDVAVVDESELLALIAVQGPHSRAILAATSEINPETPQALPDQLAELKYYRTLIAEFAGNPILIARTGYTGEDGFELYLPVALAERLWEALTEAGAEHGLVPAGLAARDTLRLEAGMPLYGHELETTIFPKQAGLARVVDMTKTDFVGRTAVEAGPPVDARVLVGLVGDSKRAARAGYDVFAQSDSAEPIGTVTSGALSPTLGYPIAMAYLDPAFSEPGAEVIIDIRGKRSGFHVTEIPFYRRKKQ